MSYGPLPGLRVVIPSAYAGAGDFVSYNFYRRPLRTILDEHETAEVVTQTVQTLMQRADLFDGYQGALAMRCSFPWDNTSEPGGGTGIATIWVVYEDANDYLWLYYDEATNSYKFARAVAGVVTTVTIAASVVVDAAVTLTARWTTTAIGLSLNGAAFQTAATGSGEIVEDYIDIGTRQGFDVSNVDVDWVVTFAGTLDNTDAATIYAWADDEWGDYPPSLEPLRDLTTTTTAIPSGLWASLEDTSYKVVPADWTLIKTETSQTRLAHTDRRAWSRQVYQYAVTVTANLFGDALESDKQTPPLQDSNTQTELAIHNVHDETDYVLLSARAQAVAPAQEVGYVLARGRTKRTAQYGELEDSRIRIDLVPHLLSDRTDWQQLRKFFTKQREAGAVFCVRPHHAAEGWYAQIDKLPRGDDVALWSTGIELAEAFVDEDELA